MKKALTILLLVSAALWGLASCEGGYMDPGVMDMVTNGGGGGGGGSSGGRTGTIKVVNNYNYPITRVVLNTSIGSDADDDYTVNIAANGGTATLTFEFGESQGCYIRPYIYAEGLKHNGIETNYASAANDYQSITFDPGQTVTITLTSSGTVTVQ